MNLEIERKFLVTRNANRMPSLPGLLAACQGSKNMIQGYLHEGKPSTRVRLDVDSKVAHLCIKTKRRKDGAKPEYEYPIPYSDGEELLASCGSRIAHKTRYEWVIYASGYHPRCVFEIDVFTSDNLKGLVIAEVEKPDYMTMEQFNNLAVPAWCHQELTGLKGWSNRRLVTDGIPQELKLPRSGFLR